MGMHCWKKKKRYLVNYPGISSSEIYLLCILKKSSYLSTAFNFIMCLRKLDTIKYEHRNIFRKAQHLHGAW